jgi:hypothetical protein
MKKQLLGFVFGRLTVVRNVEIDGRCECRCSCGQPYQANRKSLISGNLRSCGCLRRETAAATGRAGRLHNMKDTRPMRIWNGMTNRCHNPNAKDFAAYGARGITVCDSWRKFLGFWTDMAQGYSDELQIDRIDGTKGYSKENCRWATVKQQQRNRKSNHTIETPKGPMLVIEASEAFGIPVGCLSMRIRSWPQLRWFEPKRPHVRRPL